MSTSNTRSTDYSNTSTSGVTAGEAIRHPVDAAKAAMSNNSGTHTGTGSGHTGEPFSTGRGGVGNIAGSNTGTTGTGGLTEPYGSQSTTGAGLSGVGAGTAGTGLTGEHHGHHHGHHGHHGEHHTDEMHSTGTHVPGNALGTGEGRLPGTGNTGMHSHSDTTGYETGRGGAGNLTRAAGATTAETNGHHMGTHTGTHTGASAVEGDHKPTMGEKIKGTVATMTGKLTNDPEKVAEGQQLKEGTHPSQTGSGSTGASRHGGI
jgi:hypothetical protein